MKNRRTMIAAVAALAAAAICACSPSPPPPEPPPIPIVIGTDCDIASPPHLQRGDYVSIAYFGPCDWIDIEFGGTALFGCASIRLNHGESVVMQVTTPAPPPDEVSYTLTINCSCDLGDGHTTPEIKVGPPPPP